MTVRSLLCPGPVSRRSFLEVGSLVLGGLGLSDLMRLRAAAATQREAADTSVILIWLEGGPSHLETYDMKPDAPIEYRGEFGPISTNVPGIDVCELMPRHAQVADRFTLIRSISHDVSDHPGAAGRFLTGRRPRNISDPVSEHPAIDRVVSRIRQQHRSGVPAYVSNSAELKGGGNAYLGQAANPFVIEADPNAVDFSVKNLAVDKSVASRLDDRKSLLSQLDRLRRDIDTSKTMEAGDRFNQMALSLLSSSTTREAFEIGREPNKIRDNYGRHEWGQRVLLARRLVEAGVSFVTVQLREFGTAPKKGPYTWDDHGDVGHLFNNMRIRLPVLDRAVAALIEDVYQRGLDKKVMVIVAGEFGRTPKVNMGRAATPKWPGRDHWPSAMSVLVSGGGMRTGQVVGSTNAKGEVPHNLPVSPNDFLATVYRFLGIDPETTFLDFRGRPMPVLPSGRPIAELL